MTLEQETPKGLLGTVIRGAGLAAGGYALAQTLNLAAYIVLARLLVPAEFGVYAAATALLGFAMLITEAGMASALVQRRDRLEEAANTAVIATVGSGVLFGLLSLASAPLLGLFFDSSQVTAVAAAMSGFILLRIASAVPDALLQRRFSFLRRLVIEPVQVLVFAIVAIVAADAGHGVWSLVMGQYAGVTVQLVLAWALARWRPNLRLASFGMWRELIAYGRHIFVATSILNVAWQADSLIVGRAFGISLLGNFRYGFRLASTPFGILLAAAAYVLFPAFARIAHERERFQRAFLRSLRWTMMIALPLSAILIPLGVPLAVILFGEIWREAGYAAAAMAGYTAGYMISSVISEALKAEGRPDRLTRMHAVTAGLTVALMLAMIPLGFRAVAAAVSVGALGGGAYAVWTASRTLGIEMRLVIAEIWAPVVAAVAMALALLPLEAAVDAEGHGTAAGVALLLAEGLAGLALFTVLLSLISPACRHELRWAAETGLRTIRRR